jgi:hypothetical protein
MKTLSGWALALTMLVISGCPMTMDRPSTLTRLRTAIDEEVAGPTVLEDHNQLVEDIVRSSVFEGMYESEVQEALGRGEDCGVRELCRDHGFRPSDWTYEVGRLEGDPSLPAGPTLVIGFNRQGRVDRTYYVTRR